MSDKTNIEWCDYTFSPWMGCTKVSPACKNCYAERDMDHRFGKVAWGPNGTRVVTSDANWAKPLKWNKEIGERNRRRLADSMQNRDCMERPRVFCASISDVFEDWKGPIHNHKGEVLDTCLGCGAWPSDDCGCPHGDKGRIVPLTMDVVRERLFRTIDATQHLDWLLLTKRPENIRRMWHEEVKAVLDGNRLYDRRHNVWLGTSVENQEQAEKRIPELTECRDLSPCLFLSCEPLLGPVDLDFACVRRDISCIDWVIAGGESGPNARPSHPDWFRSIRDQCAAADVPFHFKQWGEYTPVECEGGPCTCTPSETCEDGGVVLDEPDGASRRMIRVGKKRAGRLLDGVEHNAFPGALSAACGRLLRRSQEGQLPGEPRKP